FINGNAVSDSLNLFDQNAPAGYTFTVTDAKVQRSGAASVAFANIKNLVLTTGPGNDTFNVESSKAGIPLTINEGVGTNTVHLSPTAKLLDNIVGIVTVNGNSATGTLIFSDQNDPFSYTYTFTNSKVLRNGFPWVTYTGQKNVLFYGGPGNVTFNV